MAGMTEKIELLGKGLYSNIPGELTLKTIPTVSELEYVGSEDFDATMLDKILPQAIEEDINPRDLLEIDYQWICRCLRILNYGPYHTTNVIFCGHCNSTSRGEYSVDLRNIPCKVLPEGFSNSVKISKDEFIDFDGDITFKLPTIQEMINAGKDKAFQTGDGKTNRDLARICYMITSFKGQKGILPFELKMKIQEQLSPADYVILRDSVSSLADYGLRAGGSTMCPKCQDKDATFIALADDRFFRPTLDDLRRWKLDRSSGAK